MVRNQIKSDGRTQWMYFYSEDELHHVLGAGTGFADVRVTKFPGHTSFSVAVSNAPRLPARQDASQEELQINPAEDGDGGKRAIIPNPIGIKANPIKPITADKPGGNIVPKKNNGNPAKSKSLRALASRRPFGCCPPTRALMQRSEPLRTKMIY
jgi:hypothetical protein